MNIILFCAIFINIVIILAFIIGLIGISNREINPKHKADFGIFMAIVMILYLIFLSLIMLIFPLKHNNVALLLLLPMITPFILGHYSRYTKIQKYTLLQIFSCIFSLIILLVL